LFNIDLIGQKTARSSSESPARGSAVLSSRDSTGLVTSGFPGFFSYRQEASRILDLSQRAYDLYMKPQDNFEKRKLVDLMVSKVVVADNRVVSNLREPFQTLARVAFAALSRKARPKWLGR
jgi:hypothetical protein